MPGEFSERQFTAVKPHGIFEPVIESVADQRVPDRNLVRPRNPLDEIAQILQIEVVARIEPQTATGEPTSACPDIRLDRPFAPGGEIPGIGLGVQLHPVGSALLRPCNHLGDGIDENRNPGFPRPEIQRSPPAENRGTSPYSIRHWR